MQVDTINRSDNPERLVCQTGRGDMYAGYIGDTAYAELMSCVNTKPEYIGEEAAALGYEPQEVNPMELPDDSEAVVRARTRSFINKQASRGHWGLWEHPKIVLTVEGISRVTMAQITRHRHMSFDVQSMRYVDFSDDADVATPATLLSHEERVDEFPEIYDEGGDHFSREKGLDDMSDRSRAAMKQVYEQQVQQSIEAYENMVAAGVPKEDARYILPLGTKVNMTVSGNARAMLHVLNLRQRGNAQWEIRALSEQIASELDDWMPYTAEWWEKNGPVPISP